MAIRDHYGKGKAEKPKPSTVHEKHAAERGETHGRHAKARDALNKQHEEELAQMASRHDSELAEGPGAGAEGGQPAAGAMNTAGAGAAAGTPAGVAGTNAA